MNYKDMLPDDIEVIQTMEIMNDQFGGSDFALFVIEVDPKYVGSNEIRDVRAPEVIRYSHLLAESVQHVADVTRATSAATVLKAANGNHLPKTKTKVIELSEDSPMIENYISKDYKMALVRIMLAEDFDEDAILVDLAKIIREVPKPAGVKVAVAGSALAMPIVKQQLGGDMQKTSTFSLIGIVLVLFLLFRSFRYSLTPLATITVGILWAFGFIGLIGMGMNTATSGVISMIMGIGIDFGIQTVTRFRQELKKLKPELAMHVTLNAVFIPMATTTLAALIGFKAMSLGELTMMAQMGTMMSYGITACFLVAITVVPAILVIGEKLKKKKTVKRSVKMKIKKITQIMIVFLSLLLLASGIVSAGAINPAVKVSIVNQDPDPVEAGKVVEVRFKVENMATQSRDNFILEIMPEYPFSLYSGTAKRDLGKLRAEETGADAAIVDYKLRVDEYAVEGDNEIKIRYKFGDDNYWVNIKDLFIDVEVTEINFQLGSLQTEPTRLVGDTDDAELLVELQNIGDGKAENVMTKLILPEGFKASYGYSDRSNLGTIDAESSKTATFYVDVDEGVKEGEYEAELVVHYKKSDDQDSEYITETIPVSIPVKATPMFKIVDVETLPKTIRIGDTVELKITVENIGSKDAESVSIKAFKESSQPFDFDEKSDFIGKLKPGETGEAIFRFNVEEDAAAKTYLLDLEIRTIHRDDVLVFEKTVPVKITNHEAKRSKELIKLIIIGAGMFLAVGVIWLVSRIRKKK